MDARVLPAFLLRKAGRVDRRTDRLTRFTPINQPPLIAPINQSITHPPPQKAPTRAGSCAITLTKLTSPPNHQIAIKKKGSNQPTPLNHPSTPPKRPLRGRAVAQSPQPNQSPLQSPKQKAPTSIFNPTNNTPPPNHPTHQNHKKKAPTRGGSGGCT